MQSFRCNARFSRYRLLFRNFVNIAWRLDWNGFDKLLTRRLQSKRQVRRSQNFKNPKPSYKTYQYSKLSMIKLAFTLFIGPTVNNSSTNRRLALLQTHPHYYGWLHIPAVCYIMVLALVKSSALNLSLVRHWRSLTPYFLVPPSGIGVNSSLHFLP